MTMRMVNYTVHDEKIVMIRKVLTIEQFRDTRARELATKHFLTVLADMFTYIFNYTAAQEADFLQKRTDSADEIKLMAGAGPASVICPVDRCRSRM